MSIKAAWPFRRLHISAVAGVARFAVAGGVAVYFVYRCWRRKRATKRGSDVKTAAVVRRILKPYPKVKLDKDRAGYVLLIPTSGNPSEGSLVFSGALRLCRETSLGGATKKLEDPKVGALRCTIMTSEVEGKQQKAAELQLIPREEESRLRERLLQRPAALQALERIRDMFDANLGGFDRTPEDLCTLILEFTHRPCIVYDHREGPMLKLFADYLNHHNGVTPAEIPKPVRSVIIHKIVEDPWDADFINSLSKKTIFLIILMANEHGCKSLLHLGCAKIATMIKGKSPEEIKRILGDD